MKLACVGNPSKNQKSKFLLKSKQKSKKGNNPTATSAVLVRRLSEEKLIQKKAVIASLETQRYKPTNKLTEDFDDSESDSDDSSWQSKKCSGIKKMQPTNSITCPEQPIKS